MQTKKCPGKADEKIYERKNAGRKNVRTKICRRKSADEKMQTKKCPGKADEKISGRKNMRTKKCPDEKMSGRKYERTKISADENKSYEKMLDEKTLDE